MLINIVLIGLLLFLILMGITALVHVFSTVPYVPSSNRVVKKMIALAKLKPNEVVYDLGCGDGRLLIAAEKTAKCNRTEGFEIAPMMYILAKLRAYIAHSRARIHFKNFFNANLRRANVIFCYLIPNVMPRLAAKLKRECSRGTRIISNTFHIPNLKPLRIIKKQPKKGLPTIYVYKI